MGLTGIAKIIAYFGQTFFRKSKETFCLFQLTPHNEAADIEAELFFELVCQIRAASSDKTLSEISNYLCFSSQSYFQTVFKKKYGLTPTQYRDQTHKIY